MSGAWALLALAVLLLPWPRARPSATTAAARGDGALIDATGGHAGGASLPLVLDLCAAGLRAGRPPDDALLAAAAAAGGEVREQLDRVAGLLRLGATAEQAWAAVPPGSALAPVVPVAVRSAASGLRLAGAFESLASELREVAAAGAAARAHRAGVWAMAPLGLCFLPSFVCLGIVPVIIGVARGVGAAVP